MCYTWHANGGLGLWPLYCCDWCCWAVRVQIDMDAMHNEDIPMLLTVLEEQRRRGASNADVDLEAAAVKHTQEQSGQLLLPSEGPTLRPDFKQVDQG